MGVTVHEMPPLGHNSPCPGSIGKGGRGAFRAVLLTLAVALSVVGCDEGGEAEDGPHADALSACTATGYKSAAVCACHVETVSRRLDAEDARFYLGAWLQRDIHGLSDEDAAAALGVSRSQFHERRQVLWQRLVDDLSRCGG